MYDEYVEVVEYIKKMGYTNFPKEKYEQMVKEVRQQADSKKKTTHQ